MRALRKQRGWTIEELALRIESDVGNISRLERGKQGFTDDTLQRLSDALGVCAGYLLRTDPRSNASIEKPPAAAKLNPVERKWLDLFANLDKQHQRHALTIITAVLASW